MRTPSRVVAKFVRRAALCLWLAPALVAAQDLARMEQLIRARVDDKSFMGTVLVARGDEVLLSKGYGSANLEWQLPNTPSTRFRLGSITKQFTAAAILLLAERGKLALEDPGQEALAGRAGFVGRASRSSICSRTRSGFRTSRTTPNTCRLEVRAVAARRRRSATSATSRSTSRPASA